MDYIGKLFRANTRLILPTGHIVEPGETFRFLAGHASVNVPLWLAAGNAELVEDEPLKIPSGAPRGKPAAAPAAGGVAIEAPAPDDEKDGGA